MEQGKLATLIILFYLSVCVCRLGELTCGYRGNEILVCCPQGGFESPFTYHHSSSQGSSPSGKKTVCGQPLFNSIKVGGSGGLGSHPWVARIGYISKKVKCHINNIQVTEYLHIVTIVKLENINMFVEKRKSVMLYFNKGCLPKHYMFTTYFVIVF